MSYDPKASLQHYPYSMAQFGVNPFGENLYRIVFNGTRRSMVGGLWSSGKIGYEWLQTYDAIPAHKWILEKWLSAWDFTGMSQERWDLETRDPVTGMLCMGLYPSRGEYELLHAFVVTSPGDANIGELIQRAERAKLRTPQQVAQRAKADNEAEEKQRDAKLDGMIRESLPAYFMRPMVGAHAKRSTKSYPIELTAHQAGLPTRRGPAILQP